MTHQTSNQQHQYTSELSKNWLTEQTREKKEKNKELKKMQSHTDEDNLPDWNMMDEIDDWNA